jgi:uncharacterized protein YjdB
MYDYKEFVIMKNTFKALGIIALLAVLWFSFISCDENSDLVSVTGVTLNKAALTLAVGGTETLTAVVSPAGASDKAVTWNTSNSAIARVSNGVVTAVAAGSASIAVTTNDGGKIAFCAVTVTPGGGVIAVTGVTLNKDSLSIAVGVSETLTAAVSPFDADDKAVTWSSDNTDAATVSEYGVVTGMAVGTAVITVTTVDGGKTAACAVSVSAAIPVTGVSLDKTSASIVAGASETLTAVVTPDDATDKNVTWNSNNPVVATVANGVVTAFAAGSAVITVTTNDGGKTADCEVTVISIGIPVTGVSLDKTTLSLAAGASETLTATVAPVNAAIKSLKWGSNAPAVATVADGRVTGVAAGSAVITVTTDDGGKTATCTVSVRATVIPVTGVTLNKRTTGIQVGATEMLTATVSPANATNKAVTWSSSNEEFATVSENGVVTGVAEGNVNITVTTVDGDRTATCAVALSAERVPVTGLGLDRYTLTLAKGGRDTLTETITPNYATNQNVTWDSNDERVATVSEYGIVTGIGPGEAEITVTSIDDEEITAVCKVTIPATAATLAEYLARQPSNTAASPYVIPLRVSGASEISLISAALRSAPSKYVSINLSDSAVTSIESAAFQNCASLAGITIPANVTSIASDAFRGAGLLSVTIPGTVGSVSVDAFRDCTSLTRLNISFISGAVTSIGNSAFYGCTSLESVTLLADITSIGNNVFYGCTSLTSITIPSNVTVIGNYVFYGCTSLKSATISGNVTDIGVGAFRGCSKLENVIMPTNIKSIGNSAFQDCAELAIITIPSSVTDIGNSAFQGCAKLASVTFYGPISSSGFSTVEPFPGNLRAVFYGGSDNVNGTPGTYKRTPPATTWTN